MGDVTLDIALEAVREVLAHKGANPDRFVLGRDTSLQSLAFDSLDIAMLFFALEDHAGVELDPDSTPLLETIQDLTNLHANAGQHASDGQRQS
jgi:acyl carrier protein